MQTHKIKQLITKANAELKTEPFSLASSAKAFQENTNLICDTLNSVKCFSCEEVRRQNYQLKQQLFEQEDRN